MEIDAIAFDAFGTLFDREALREPLGDEAFEGFTQRFSPWLWHLSAAQRFVPLRQVAAAALEAAGADPAHAERLESLPAFPDVKPALDALAGRRLGILSNSTSDGLRRLVANAGLDGRFEHLLAADQAERYKPAPEIYALAPRAFGVAAERVLLVSSNEWDVAGASFAGLRTAWVARGKEPAWVLGVEADMRVAHLHELPGTA